MVGHDPWCSSAGGCGGYHALVQLIYLIAAGSLIALVGGPLLLGLIRARGLRDPVSQIALAAAAGAVGAALIFVLRIDFVPDALEKTGDPLLVLLATVAVVAMAVYGYRSR
jgi:hypothetical protein